MKTLKKALSLLLVFCMVLGITSVIPSKEAKAADDDLYKIVHLDCGRKYFSPENIKKIIDNAAAAGFNQVELYLSDNQGFRFALDDMNITTSTGNTYDLTPTLGDGYSDGSKYPDGSGKYLTQSEMTDIISYAKGKGIDIVPCINVPGHMGAILEEFTDFRYSSSKSSIDLENEAAVAFALAITEKYAAYFAGQEVKYYNLGADEYANDMSTMGFQGLYTSGKYQKFVDFLNKAAQIVINHGMTPRAFNDGICYNDDTSYGINKSIQVCYWSKGWSGYNVASADTLKNAGYELINTHGDYYWGLGNSSWQCSAEKASGFAYTSFPDGTVEDPVGAMFCIWCDNGAANGQDDGATVVSATANVISAFGAALQTNENGGSESGGDNTGDVAVTENETITVIVGGTTEATISGANYAGTYSTEAPSIATVEVTGKDAAEATTTYTQASVTCDNLISSNSNSWRAVSGYYYKTDDGNYYPVYAKRSSSSVLFWTTYTYTWGYSTTLSTSNVTQIGTQETNSTSNIVNIAVYEESGTAAVPASTTVTFKGAAVGTTYVTVGNTRYTINVIAEDLTKVTPLTVEYWITNVRVTGSDSATSKSIQASAAGVYSEEGTELSKLVPATGTANGQPDVFWKGTRLDSDNQQTTGGGVDKTKSGTDFVYIRYWNGAWSYSADRESWTSVVSGDQIVAYYLQKTTVTDEVTTYVVDWGPDYSDYTDRGNYVLLDFAVQYESGERVPTSFPNTAAGKKTKGFHCDTSSTNLGKVTFQDGNTYYRHLGMIKGEETADYEIYMITLTPTSDTKTTQLSGSSASANNSYTYDGTEKVVWVDDEANLGDFADKKHGDFSVGGEPIVPQLNIYNKQGMLVTYYVRAKVTEDALTVHYIDKTAGQEFYNYNIAVNSGTVFNAGFALDNGKNKLVNNTVTNKQGNTQTVSADLSTMPAIGAQYRYSDYKCVEVVRSEDGKEVYLYYTFNNAHSFVVDFGLPLKISTTDLNISGDWSSVTVSGAKYGTASATIGDGITYIPNKVFQGVETLQLTLTGSEGSTTHQIYIYPATTVYYEEGFAEYSVGWTSTGSKGTGTQTTEAVGEKTYVYGYDPAYAGSKESVRVGASAGSQATSSTFGDKATFAFQGTGVGIYANCTTGTGRLMIQVKSATTNKLVQVQTALVDGEKDVTDGQAVEGYNVPVTVFKDLAYDTYTVTISHIKVSSASGSATNEVVNLDGFRVYNTLGTTAEATYEQDYEERVSFTEVRDLVLSIVDLNGYDGQYGSKEDIISQVFSKVTTAGAEATGAILNGNDSYNADVLRDLIDNGPKNEVYLFNNQTLVLNVNTIRDTQIGLKALNDKTTYTVNGGETKSLDASTDMFYKVERLNENSIIIKNTGSGILSVTMLKIFDAPAGAIQPITEDNVKDALTVLGYIEPEVTYADATLNITVKDKDGKELASTVLTANGTAGEVNTFSAASIEEAAAGILPEGYELVDASYSDTEVVYGEAGEVSFTASEKAAEPVVTPSEPMNIIYKIIVSIKNFFGKLFGR